MIKQKIYVHASEKYPIYIKISYINQKYRYFWYFQTSRYFPSLVTCL